MRPKEVVMRSSAMTVRLCQSVWCLTAILLVVAVASNALPSFSAGAADDDQSFVARPGSVSNDGQAPGRAQLDAIAAFSQQNPRASFYQTGARITRVYGTTFAAGDGPEDTAEQFRLNYAAMFGVEPVDLRPISILVDRRHTQPVMYNRPTGDYKFTLVYYSQHLGGIPVFRADWRLLVRNEFGYPLVLVVANLRDLGDFTAAKDPTASEDAKLGKAAAKELVPTLQNFTQPERVIWAGVDDMIVEPAVAYTFIADNRGVPSAPRPENWVFVADATTGEILYKESRIVETDVEGNVSGLASQGIGADFCEPEELEAMSYARVNIGGTNAYADEFGDFVIPNAGDSPVTVQSPVRGLRFRVFNYVGPDTVLSMNVIPPGPANFIHNAFNNSEFIRAEVNAYSQANEVYSVIVGANPNYPVISTQTEFAVNVNRSDDFYCPGAAWYDGDSINFCRTGQGYPNTAWSSMVHHEFGHHLVAMGGSGQGQYGEGMGDVMSVVVLDDPRVGLGYWSDCNSWLRDADNNMQYPCTGNNSFCGQLLSGCVWDTRAELTVTEPEDYLEILRNLSVNSVLLHSGSIITPQITIDWLILDDDDGDISNGTPHYFEIAAGFGAHNMPAPEADPIDFEYPDGLPTQVTPNQPTVIRVNVVPLSGTPLEGSGTVSYSVDGGPFSTVAMDEISPNQYEATLPPANCLLTIDFYFSAQTVDGMTVTDPPDAPAITFSAIAITGATTAFEDDFEANQGWTVTNSPGLQDGGWQRGVPAGGGDRGDPPTDADGSGQCYVTDNTDGDSDVDEGSTTLSSPIMDASQSGTAISYYRWYSNTEGAAPMQDTFVVQVSNDGGSSWVDLETVGPTGPEVGGEWFYSEFSLADIPGFEPNDQFRIRFIASDTDPQSIVEAGVDGVRLFAYECEENPCEADLDGNGFVGPVDLAVLLGAWGPCPDCPADLDGNGQVGPLDLALLLGAWGPCP